MGLCICSYNVYITESLTTTFTAWSKQIPSPEGYRPSASQEIRHIYIIRRFVTAIKRTHSERDKSSAHIPILFI
jgi:hypothetical protein